MILNAKIILLMLALLSSFSWAQAKSAEVIVPAELSLYEPAISSLVRDIESLLKDLAPQRAQIQVVDGQKSCRSKAWPGRISLCLGKGLRDHDFLVTLAHEYGHLVFYDFVKNYEARSDKNLNNRFSILAQNPQPVFNELFGDLLAALYFGEPDIVARSLKKEFGSNPDYSVEVFNYRDFSRRYSEMEWQKLLDSGKIIGTHELLSFSRFHIWEAIQKKNIDRKDISRVLLVFMDSALSVIESQEPGNLFENRVLEFNQKFVKCFQSKLNAELK